MEDKSTEKIAPEAPIKLQTLDFPKGTADNAPEGMVCGPDGCVAPERAVDAVAAELSSETEPEKKQA